MKETKLEKRNSKVARCAAQRASIFAFRFSIFSFLLLVLCGELLFRGVVFGGSAKVADAHLKSGQTLGSAKPLANEAHTTSQPLTLETYTAELDQRLVDMHRLKDHPQEAARIRQELPPAWVVVVDGQKFDVSTEWLRSALEAFEKDPQTTKLMRATAQLAAMRHDARALADSPPPNWQTVRQKLAEILARREFHEVHGPTWIDMLNERLSRWWAKLMRRLSLRIGSHPTGTRVVLWGFLLVAAGSLLVWMVQRLLQRPRDTLRLDILQGAPIMETWQQMLQAARESAGRGDFRGAIRRAYWAGIVRLENLGMWTADRARTHREYLRLLNPDLPQREPLAALTREFERAWYAGQPASEEDFQTVLSQVEKL